ncbi:hypothetical protein [Ruminobacter sp.]|uniref:hypothetical protein n=1 Tax=Ruminobacter sp. TaxID=2774296 RepID=UPI00257D9B16|nr:hypothetical protein [Ruminobacter sp.]
MSADHVVNLGSRNAVNGADLLYGEKSLEVLVLDFLENNAISLAVDGNDIANAGVDIFRDKSLCKQ